MCIYPDAESIAIGNIIYLFLPRIEASSIHKLIIHEYVHVCIEATFNSTCPLWLNEGLALYISGQKIDIVSIQCDNIDYFYGSNYSEPYFYNKSLFIVNELINKIGLTDLIDISRKCRHFHTDPTVGVEAIKLLLKNQTTTNHADKAQNQEEKPNETNNKKN